MRLRLRHPFHPFTGKKACTALFLTTVLGASNLMAGSAHAASSPSRNISSLLGRLPSSQAASSPLIGLYQVTLNAHVDVPFVPGITVPVPGYLLIFPPLPGTLPPLGGQFHPVEMCLFAGVPTWYTLPITGYAGIWLGTEDGCGSQSGLAGSQGPLTALSGQNLRQETGTVVTNSTQTVIVAEPPSCSSSLGIGACHSLDQAVYLNEFAQGGDPATDQYTATDGAWGVATSDGGNTIRGAIQISGLPLLNIFMSGTYNATFTGRLIQRL